mmetsp:Transcript_25244/g.37000  ORF Transcript_25244/g.37000 Transcript_25244/m.37000 type:complete len:87 (-) Transcript_25244:139-399(-)
MTCKCILQFIFKSSSQEDNKRKSCLPQGTHYWEIANDKEEGFGDTPRRNDFCSHACKLAQHTFLVLSSSFSRHFFHFIMFEKLRKK